MSEKDVSDPKKGGTVVERLKGRSLCHDISRTEDDG